jgi:predicted translin family RNA/ssDNA-binding protein
MNAQNLQRTLEDSLIELARCVLQNILNGNLGTARAMLNQVEPDRRYFVAMWLYHLAGTLEQKNAINRVILSITK